MSVQHVTLVGFTAARKLPTGMTEAQADEVVTRILDVLDPVSDWLVLGAALGMERRIGLAARARGFKVHVIVPGVDPRTTAGQKIDQRWMDYATGHEQLPMNDPNPFRARNHAVVAKAEYLFALPAYPEKHEESLRSGTWMTVRIAQRAGKEVIVLPLSDQLAALADVVAIEELGEAPDAE